MDFQPLSPLSIKPTKSELMVWYNRARSAAKRGKLDLERVNRAFGWLQMKEPHIYQTTVKTCSCPDRMRHPEQACKHMIGAMILSRIADKRKADKPQKPAIKIVSVGVQNSRNGYIRYDFKDQDSFQSWLSHNNFSTNQFKQLNQLHGHVDKFYNMKNWEIDWSFKAKSIYQP